MPTKNIPHKIQSATCGELLELMDGKTYPVSIVIGDPILPTKGHYHRDHDEIYICMQGTITLDLFNQQTNQRSSIILEKYESLVVAKRIHHRIIDSEPGSILLAISIPGWTPEGQRLSETLGYK